MAGKAKDFKAASTGRLYETIEQATQDAQDDTTPRKTRKTYTVEELEQIIQEGTTRGKKGAKMPRCYMAFEPDILAYIKIMSNVMGYDQTQFVNKVVREHMEANQDVYERALEFRKTIKARL